MRTTLKQSTLKLSVLTIITSLWLAGCSKPVEPETDVIRPIKLFNVVDTGMQNLREFPATVIANEEAEISFRIPGELVELKVNYDNVKTRLESATIAVQLVQNKLEDSVLTAPFDGRVAETMVENYQFIQAQQTILVLQGSNALDISIQVPESILKNLREDQVNREYQPTVVFSGNSNEEYKVSYKEHSTLVTPGTQSYQVWFTLPVPEDLTVYPGMGAMLSMDLSRVSPGANNVSQFVVPMTAVMTDDTSNQKQVWVYDADTGTVNPEVVTLGRITQSGITVLSGLNAGDQIASAGLNRLEPGMKVKPLERERGL